MARTAKVTVSGSYKPDQYLPGNVNDGRFDVRDSIVGKIKQWLKEFIETIKGAFGLKSDAAVLRALSSAMKGERGIGGASTENIMGAGWCDEAVDDYLTSDDHSCHQGSSSTWGTST